MGQQALGSLAVLFWVVVIGFFMTPTGSYVLIGIIGLVVVSAALIGYADYQPWATYDPPLPRGAKYLLAKGRVKEGRFVLTREGVPGRSGFYPFILTLTYVDKAGRPISAKARLIKGINDNGKVCVGHYHGNAVYIDVDTTAGDRLVFFGEPNGYDTWQVFPPPPDQTLWVSPQAT